MESAQSAVWTLAVGPGNARLGAAISEAVATGYRLSSEQRMAFHLFCQVVGAQFTHLMSHAMMTCIIKQMRAN